MKKFAALSTVLALWCAIATVATAFPPASPEYLADAAVTKAINDYGDTVQARNDAKNAHDSAKANYDSILCRFVALQGLDDETQSLFGTLFGTTFSRLSSSNACIGQADSHLSIAWTQYTLAATLYNGGFYDQCQTLAKDSSRRSTAAKVFSVDSAQQDANTAADQLLYLDFLVGLYEE